MPRLSGLILARTKKRYGNDKLNNVFNGHSFLLVSYW